MHLIDFKSNAKQSFIHGFIKGLGAPAMLRHVETAEPVNVPMIDVPGHATVHDALARDWMKIGGDISSAIEQYDKETQHQPAKK